MSWICWTSPLLCLGWFLGLYVNGYCFCRQRSYPHYHPSQSFLRGDSSVAMLKDPGFVLNWGKTNLIAQKSKSCGQQSQLASPPIKRAIKWHDKPSKGDEQEASRCHNDTCTFCSPEQVTGHLVFQSIHDYLDELPDDYDTEEIDMWPCWETSDHDRETNYCQY